MPMSEITRLEMQREAGNQQVKEHRERRRDAGLCIECGLPSVMFRCDDCAQRVRDSQKRCKDRRRGVGKCTSCGGEIAGNYRKCDTCRESQRAANKQCYKRKRIDGECVFCGEKVDQGVVACKNCNDKKNENGRKRRKRYTDDGKCRECGQEAQLSNRTLRGKERGNYCAECWMKVLAGCTLGSRKHWKILVEKLDACGWRCPYTGEELVLGVNLSFDHKNSICRFPEQKHAVDNVEPVSWRINLMKRDLTKKEFLGMVERIHANTEQKRSNTV